MTITTEDIRAYLADQYSVEIEDVRTGAEADEEAAGLYEGEDYSWLVHVGKQPSDGPDCTGWIYVGSTDGLKRQIRDYQRRPGQ